MVEQSLFIRFSVLAVMSAVRVIRSANPIHSVLWLILAFCQATCLLLLFGLEFLAMLFLMVYVGAIAVLFLFVVMMLDVHQAEIRETSFQYLPIGGLIGLRFFLESLLVLEQEISPTIGVPTDIEWFEWAQYRTPMTHMEALGMHLYQYHVDLFLIASLILLVAMIGAIVLTMRTSTLVKRQDIYRQTFRNFDHTVQLIAPVKRKKKN